MSVLFGRPPRWRVASGACVSLGPTSSRPSLFASRSMRTVSALNVGVENRIPPRGRAIEVP
eukprot:scaffold23561_cov32-Tisochrysis_lutea.AAC.3